MKFHQYFNAISQLSMLESTMHIHVGVSVSHVSVSHVFEALFDILFCNKFTYT